MRGSFGRGLDILACTPGTSVTRIQRLAWKFWHNPLLKLTTKLERETGGFEQKDYDSPMTREYKRFMRNNNPDSK